MRLTKEELELRKISWDSSLANWSIIVDLLDTLEAERDSAKAQVAAVVRGIVSRLTKERDERYATDSKSHIVATRYIEWAQDSLFQSGQEALDRVVQQAVREEAEWWGYAHCHAFEADEFNCKLCQRLAAHRAAAGAPFPVDKHAKPDILDNKYTEWPLPGPSEDKQ